eukprot:5353128-Alexandrium_andersonii.AAC.1
MGHSEASGLSMRWVEHEALRAKPTLGGAETKTFRIGIRAPPGSLTFVVLADGLLHWARGLE